jgi:hypothetical protein
MWSSQDLVEILPTGLVSGLKLLRTKSAEMTMTARAIVEEIDVIGYVADR